MSLSGNELQHLEAQLRSVSPARPPADFLRRLQSEAPALVAARRAETGLPASPKPMDTTAVPHRPCAAEHASWESWLRLVLGWGVPATAVLIIGALVWWASLPTPPGPQSSSVPLKADDVRIDQQLVSIFDTVAPLPGGEPVRFRCREWMDETVFRDTRRGVEVARRVPRVEVVPVRFETY